MSVLISTCLSWPFASFFTLTLHANRSRSATKLAVAMKNAVDLFLAMLRTSIGDLDGPVQSRSPLGNIRNTYGKMPVNGNLPKQCLDRGDLRDRRVGKSAN